MCIILFFILTLVEEDLTILDMDLKNWFIFEEKTLNSYSFNKL